MRTLRSHTLAAFLAGAALTVIAGITFQAWRADAAPGDSDATLVPIAPCRLIDTRPTSEHVGPHGPFGADETKTIQAHGSNGNCTIPTEAVGLSLNVAAAGATAPTFLTIWPFGDLPDASSLNPFPGQPPTPNAVTTNLSGTGSFHVYNLAGSVNVIIDVNGYYTRSSLQALHNRIAALEAKTASMSATSVEGLPTVRFTGVNLQILDGTDETACSRFDVEDCNGLGNLIVGYNEGWGTELRTGSHNLVTGTLHDWTAFGGLVAGTENTISGRYASVTGGEQNVASGLGSSVSGGDENTASGLYSSVSGGRNNNATDIWTSVSGGGGNSATVDYASVSGGHWNLASGASSSVTGGTSNTASGAYSSVSGGTDNTAADYGDSVPGGDDIYCNALNQSAACGEGAIVPPDL